MFPKLDPLPSDADYQRERSNVEALRRRGILSDAQAQEAKAKLEDERRTKNKCWVLMQLFNLIISGVRWLFPYDGPEENAAFALVVAALFICISAVNDVPTCIASIFVGVALVYAQSRKVHVCEAVSSALVGLVWICAAYIDATRSSAAK